MTAAELLNQACNSGILCATNRELHMLRTEGALQAITGGGIFNPPSPANLFLWLRPESLSALADNDPVHVWPDSGMFGHDVNDASTAPPTYKLNQIGGRPGVRFDGINDALLGNPGPFGTQYTAFIVLKYDSAAGTSSAVTMGTGAGMGLLKSAGSRSTVRVGINESVDGVCTTNAELWSAVATGAPLTRFFLSGVNQAITNSGSLITDPGGGTFHIGEFAASAFMAGVICEFLFYDIALPDTNRQTVENYLKSKFLV